MIVVDNEVSNSPTPSILDSPTLARVERARIRNESTSTYNSPLNQTMSSYCPWADWKVEGQLRLVSRLKKDAEMKWNYVEIMQSLE
ncbi:hypothetical protein M8J75_014958 [Diaphorina citri]|nr:hypothetical protein M8J75_014958 [Diaphorina citri]